eukprot:5923169-Pleurochrysis_carterae.AAC.1
MPVRLPLFLAAAATSILAYSNPHASVLRQPRASHALPSQTAARRCRSAVPYASELAALQKIPLEPFEAKLKSFAPAAELPELRSQALRIEQQLEDAIEAEDFVQAAMLRDDLAELRSRDPAVLASALRRELDERVKQERYSEAARCRDQLLVLRRFQPQYQLAGLWKAFKAHVLNRCLLCNCPNARGNGRSAFSMAHSFHMNLDLALQLFTRICFADRQLPEPRGGSRALTLRGRHSARDEDHRR